jgi:Carboxypeptidase regulatory-like domain/TonB dependent receptor
LYIKNFGFCGASPRRLAACLLAIFGITLCACCIPSYGQERDKALIVGTITDSSGAAIVGAIVTVRDVDTNATFTVKTNAEGFYTSPSLQIGKYNVTVKKSGFETASESNIVLDVGTRTQVDLPMHPGSIDVQVTVEASSPALNTTSGTLGYVVDQRAIEDLPLNGGNALALAAIMPGVVNAFGATTSGFSDRGAMLSAIRLGGGPVGAYANTLDGASNQITYLGEVAINPQADSIAQFRLYNGSTPAQFGFTSGGAIDMATRAGTNQIHGTLYEFFRNDAVDAQNFFASPLVHKPELRYNRFGGSISGPIRRDKMFLFANSERYQLVATNPNYLTVPTPLERTGDFSQSGIVTTPSSTYPTGCKPVTLINPSNNTPFPNDAIPTQSLDTTALAIQTAFYPLPNNSSGLFSTCSHANNYVSTARTYISQQLTMGRIDYQATPKNGFFLRYGYYHFLTDANSGLPDYRATGRTDNPTNQAVTFGYTRVLSPSFLNDLRISGLRAKFTFLAGSHDQNIAASFGIGGASIPLTMPTIFNGVAAFQTIYGYRSATQFQVVDTATKQLGTQALTFGVDLRFNQALNNQNNQGSGSFNFDATTTGNPNVACNNALPVAPCTGALYASYLLGTVASGTLTIVTPATFRSSSASAYIQDDWRATKNLTLNIGLRYDYQQQPYELRNHVSNFDITRTDPVNGFKGANVYAGAGGYGRTFNRESYTDFSPRFGFAWGIPHEASTILRGGYSIYYSSTANISFTNNPSASATTNYNATLNNGVALTLKGGFPYAATVPNSNNSPDFGIGNGTVDYNEPDQKTPMSQVFTLSISKPLPSKFVLDVSYLGNKGVHFVEPNYNMNQLDPKYYYLGNQNGVDNLQATDPANPYFGRIPANSSANGASIITYFNLYKPYPYYANVADYQPRNGRYFGNYMYVSLQRRMANGTQVIGAYTLGKLISDPIYVPINQSGGISTGFNTVFQNNYNRGIEHSIDALDVTHRMTLSVLSLLPVGHGQKFLNNPGWESAVFSSINLNTIITLQGGTPLAMTGANNYIASRPSFSGINPKSNCNTSNGVTPFHTHQCWFNPDAFINPVNYTFGNVPRTLSNLRGPGAVNIDASMLKTFRVVEKYDFQFRLEGFNIFNHPNFNNPNTAFTAIQNTIKNTNTADTNANFGVITSAQSARVFQAGLKFIF